MAVRVSGRKKLQRRLLGAAFVSAALFFFLVINRQPSLPKEKTSYREGREDRQTDENISSSMMETELQNETSKYDLGKSNTTPILPQNRVLNGNLSGAMPEKKENVEKASYRPNEVVEPRRRGGARRICPDYFKHIWEDLQPWRQRGGISEEVIAYTQRGASFRLQIVNGEVFVHHFRMCYQTRAMFTIWGILQLIKRFPSRVPDVDLMIHCMDQPLIRRSRFLLHPHPPLLLKYCSSPDHMDVVWPDWSFWGWPEVKIERWPNTREKISEGSGGIPWRERENLGQWKGAVWVAPRLRQPIVDCHDAPNHQWRVKAEDTKWLQEISSNSTKLENQCNYRYKIYVEGTAWSCSLKYLMACGSTLLYVRPIYFDFFSRSLQSYRHFLPVRRPDEAPICESLKEAVEWGEQHMEEAEEIGRNSAKFAAENITMVDVYDYMLHFLEEYAKLQRFNVSRHFQARRVTEASIRGNAGESTLPYLVEEDAYDGEPCEIQRE